MAGGLVEAATRAGVPLRLSAKYWAEHLGRPYQPAETYPGYSYENLLAKPRPYRFFWELWGLGSHRLLLWGNPGYVRRAVPTLRLGGSEGFEIDPPLAQKGFGNRPGKWGVFTHARARPPPLLDVGVGAVLAVLRAVGTPELRPRDAGQGLGGGAGAALRRGGRARRDGRRTAARARSSTSSSP